MECKKSILLVMVGCVLLMQSLAVFGRGTPEDAWDEVDGKEYWRHEIDITEEDPGVHNIIIRAEDFAGNEYIEGPYNIHVDPDSDLPTARTIYPEPGQIVRSSVSVVGVAVDDDAVDYVEIRQNDGPWDRAEGSEYWRYYIPAEELGDGEHTISVRGVDIYGTEGHVYTSSFLLDTAPPEIAVTSHETGAIMSGRVRIEGVATDANGIDAIYLDRGIGTSDADDSEVAESLRLRYDKDEDLYRYRFDVATEDLSDGAHIYRIRAVDSTGADAELPYLFFVDNESPEITVYSPSEESGVHGIVQVTGSILDEVGVERFWYEWEDEEHDIELIPGNPYWSIELDLRGTSGRWADVYLYAEDSSGNRTELRHRMSNDQEGAKPNVHFTAPGDFEAPPQLGSDGALYGYVSGVHHADAIIVEGITEEPQEFPAVPGFRIPLDGVRPGLVDLRVRARDVLGIVGNEQRIRFTRTAPEPGLELRQLSYANGDREGFSAGMAYDRLRPARLHGRVLTGADVDEVRVAVGSGDSVREIDARLTAHEDPEITDFRVELPVEQQFGMQDVTITAVDEFGTENTLPTQLYFRDTRRLEEEPQIILDDHRLDEDGTVRITGSNPVRGRIIGLHGGSAEAVVENLRLEFGFPVVRLSGSGTEFSIEGVADGVREDVYLRARTPEGIPLEAGPFRLEVDRRSPTVRIDTPSDPDIQGRSFSLSGSITDRIAVARAEYSIDGGASFSPLPLSSEGTERRFSTQVQLGEEIADGYGLVIRAWDSHGNLAVRRRVLNTLSHQPRPSADERPADRPEIDIVYPASGAVTMGRPQIGGIIRDLDGAERLEVQMPDGEFREVARFDERQHHQAFLYTLPPVLPGQQSIRVRAVDREGEVSREKRVRMTVASSRMDIQLTRVGEDGRISQGFRVPLDESISLHGLVRNSERLDTLQYRIDDGEYSSVRTKTDDNLGLRQRFELQLPAGLEYGKHQLELEAIDADGQRAEYRISFFVASDGDAPVYRNTVDFRDERLQDGVFRFGSQRVLTGRFDGREIAEIEQQGAEDLLEVRAAGNQVYLTPTGQGNADDLRLIVTTVDGLVYVGEPYEVVVDYEAPALELTEPYAGRYDNTSLPLEGTLEEEVELAAFEYRVQPDGEWLGIPVEGTGDFAVDIPLTEYDSGAIHLFVRAVDRFGHTAEQWVPVARDAEDPAFSFITPPGEHVINGLTSVAAQVNSRSPVVELGYSLDGGETFSPLPPGDFLLQDIDFSIQELGGPQAQESAATDGETDEDAETAEPEPQPVIFRAIDAAGNSVDSIPSANVDLEMDLPVVDIQLPAEGAVITSDFTISGMAFDDDGVDSLFWRIDGGEYQELPGSNTFSIDISLEDMTDNEHTIEMYAVDVYGLEGEVFASEFHVSLAEPDIFLTAPSVEETNRDTITLEGTAFDENGIDEVWVSMDNGNTFQQAEGEDIWTYELDTTVFTDGTYSLQVRAIDNYGIEGQYFTLVNIDNTKPFLDLATPLDAEIVSGTLELSGRVEDSVALASVVLEMEAISTDAESREFELSTDAVLDHEIDIEGLPEGWYNLRLTARDEADNTTVVARNVLVQDDLVSSVASILFPREQSQHSGALVVEGRVVSPQEVRRAQIYVNDSFVDSAEVNSRGYFQYKLDSTELNAGNNTVHAYIDTGNEDRVSSSVRSFHFEPLGPSVEISSNQVGDFISNRPWLRGAVHYAHGLDEDDRENRDALRETRADRVLISLDNGRTFDEVRGSDEWRYRIETGDIPEGPLSVVVRAEFPTGEAAVTRSLYTVDKTPPDISLLTPAEDARLNTSIQLVGTGEDEHGIESIEAALRKGDKAGYAVPAFVQGMYFETHVLGLTYYQLGLGLTFFDQNVKLQGHVGPSPETIAQDNEDKPVRLGGVFYGGKLLANVASIPFNVFFGPDWENVSMNAAVGASFNYVGLYNPVTVPQEDGENMEVTGVIISAIVAQLELPKIVLPDWSFLNAYSLYTEPQLWFISSDVAPTIEPKITFGARVQLF